MHFTYTEISGKSFSEDVSVQTVCIFIIFDSTVFTTAPQPLEHFVDTITSIPVKLHLNVHVRMFL